MGQAQINVRTRACSRTSIARTKQAALTHNVRGKELKESHQELLTLKECLCFFATEVVFTTKCMYYFLVRI